MNHGALLLRSLYGASASESKSKTSPFLQDNVWDCNCWSEDYLKPKTVIFRPHPSKPPQSFQRCVVTQQTPSYHDLQNDSGTTRTEIFTTQCTIAVADHKGSVIISVANQSSPVNAIGITQLGVFSNDHMTIANLLQWVQIQRCQKRFVDFQSGIMSKSPQINLYCYHHHHNCHYYYRLKEPIL